MFTCCLISLQSYSPLNGHNVMDGRCLYLNIINFMYLNLNMLFPMLNFAHCALGYVDSILHYTNCEDLLVRVYRGERTSFMFLSLISCNSSEMFSPMSNQ